MTTRLRTRIGALRRRLFSPSPSQPPQTEQTHTLDDNRAYWDRYAEHWTEQFRGYEIAEESSEPGSYEFLGDEWGNPRHVTEIIEEYIDPHLGPNVVALEIGSGGGRIAARVAPRVQHLYCADISREMLKRLKIVLRAHRNVSYLHVEDAILPRELGDSSIDFVYSFDVFVHLDVHTMWRYISQFGKLLRPGGQAFLHTTNLLTTGGWNRFAAQAGPTLEGHYFITPEVVHRLAERAGLTVAESSMEEHSNFYKSRDYLVILRK